MTQTRKWAAMAAVLVVAIFVAGWFLIISPKRGEAATLRQETVSQQDANTRLQQQIQVLKAQQQDLPQQQALLATFRTQIPDNPALPALIRDLTAAGKKTGVSLDALAPAAPQAVVAATPAAAPSATGTDAGDTSAPAPAAAPAATASTLFQVPLAINVTGSYFELEQFLNRLEGLRRSFLVTGFALAPGAGDGNIASDIKMTLNGRVFLSQPAATTTTPVAVPASTSGE